jgi:prepilin-type N-terminal cleavage/methylation domain-containing protein
VQFRPRLRADTRATAKRGFTLVELLVTVAIIAILLTLLLPGLRTARTSARLVRAHGELRGIALALQMYADTNAGALPPTRFSCNLRTEYELPIELGRQKFLPQHMRALSSGGFVDAIQMHDVFNPAETYKYRAVGPALVNETTLLAAPNGATLWIPDDFPSCTESAGRYHGDPRTAPVRYALWSIGPDVSSPKFRDAPGRRPLPARFWCRSATDTGVITHFFGSDGRPHQSP